MGIRREDLHLSDVAPPRYERRRPEATALFRIVQEHLESFLDDARRHDVKGLPRYVESELRAYLECGILAHGLLRAHCKACGKELVVAFSCKRRAVCPSCNARRICNTAAHLVDRVVPDIPVRQWVLSVPFDLRLLLARRADAFGALLRIFGEEIVRLQRARARANGVDGVTGGVSFPQRFGGSLNLNTHIHAVFADGVFVFRGAERALFQPLPPPDSELLRVVCENTATRLLRFLRKRRLVTDEQDHASNESLPLSAVEACDRGALGIGELTHIDERGAAVDNRHPESEPTLPRTRGKRAAEAFGFHLHAGVAVDAHNRLGREILLRYCARSPLSLERLSLLDDGRIAYRIKKPWRPDRTHRVMTPLEFMARLVALIPRPRTPLIHFHGAFAPNFRRRGLVVPAGTSLSVQSKHVESQLASTRHREGHRERTATDTDTMRGESEIQDQTAQKPRAEKAADILAPLQSPATETRPFKTAPWRIDWATLLFRVHDVDALACPCGGRLRFIELATERERAREILRRLGLPIDAPEPRPAAASRYPDDLPPPDW